MNKLFISALAGTIGFVFTARAAPIEELLKTLPGNKAKIAEKLVKVVPASTRQGIDDYLAVTGISANGGQNVGFANYNDSFLKQNPCFQDLAAEFYAELLVEDVRQRTSQGLLDPKTLMEKAKLNQTVADVGMKPGWLWEKALAKAQGDRLLAMQIIGVCGHDDMNQLNNGMRLAPESRERLKGSLTDQDLRELVNKAWKTLPEDKKKSLGSEAPEEFYSEFRRRMSFLNDNWVGCPLSTSMMYYPQALGKETDIPEKLKERIARVQAPNKGASVLPAKPYHMIGAAYSACHLVRRGIPGVISKTIVEGAFNAYRSNRVCEKLRFVDSDFPKKSVKEIIADIRKIRKNPLQCFEPVRDPETNEFFGDYRRTPRKGEPAYCESAGIFDHSILTDPDMTEEIFEAKLIRTLAELDSAEMFRKSANYKSARSCEGPQLNQAVREFLEANGAEKNDSQSCEGLSAERCQAARKVIDTYLVDFEWTEAQHLAGYEFAKKNCPKYDAGKSPEIMACKALGRTASSVGEGAGTSGVTPGSVPQKGRR